MSMNVPPEENKPTTPPATPEQTAPVDTATQEQVEANDAQVVEAVAQGLEDEEITAEDIMTAVLSDSLGISPAGAQSLFRLLMTELVDEEEPKKEEPVVPPTEEGM